MFVGALDLESGQTYSSIATRSDRNRHLSFLLVGDATIDFCRRPVVRVHQAAEKLLLDLVDARSAEITEQLHAVESSPPGIQHLRSGGSAERQLLIFQDERLRYCEPRSLQVISQLSAHLEIVPSGREPLPSVC